LDEQGVMIVPGSIFGYPGSHFRLGLGRTSFHKGLEALEQVLKDDPE
jgi:aspartate/methionine/tyrosine aminotransferase